MRRSKKPDILLGGNFWTLRPEGQTQTKHGHHSEWRRQRSELKNVKYYILMHIYVCVCNLKKNGIDEPICEAGIETQIKRTDL